MKLPTFIPQLTFAKKGDSRITTRPAKRVSNNIVTHNFPVRLSVLFS